MEIDFPALMDGSTTFLIFVLVTVGLGKVWPWFKDVYWPGREIRWQATFDASTEREKLLMEQSSAFLEALSSYQDGFATANKEQHDAMLGQLVVLSEELERYRASNTQIVTALLDRVNGKD